MQLKVFLFILPVVAAACFCGCSNNDGKANTPVVATEENTKANTEYKPAFAGQTRIKKVVTAMKFQKHPNIGTGELNGVGSNHIATKWLYKSYNASMDEGWTRWVFDKHLSFQQKPFRYESAFNRNIRNGNLIDKTDTIIFPDQAPNQILNGYAKGTMPDEYTGGIGKDGVANLRKFVEDGGTLVFLNRASRFAIEQFGLPVRDVTQGLARKDFFIPGSILRTELNTTSLMAKDMPEKSIAWFEDSPAFEITQSDDTNVQIIASYPKNPDEILLSGWALGKEKLAGKAALVSINIGKGKIILFGFRPQYRGQSLATFPLLFNALSN